MRIQGLILGIGLLIGCAQNSIERVKALDADAAPIKDGRYTNRYPGKKTYPYNCETNCYPKTDQIACKTPMSDCHYVGNNPDLTHDTGFYITWLGHASFAIETLSGKRFLFDPVFEQFDWPVNWAFELTNGVRRQPPTMNDNLLNDITAVMYSHLHYDHFNKSDVAQIGNSPRYLVPKGFAPHFDNDHYQITEMDWFTSTYFDKTHIHFVPAHHFNSRIWIPWLYEDNNKALWGGWIIEESDKTLFFAGDTGYSKHFKDINQRYGDIDICLIPIASYHHQEYETWYRYVHTRPEDAIAAANDLKCKVTIPWGYGNASWQMGDLSSHSALFRLLHTLKSVPTNTQFYIMNEGESIKM